MSSFFYRVLLAGGLALLLVCAASPSLAQEVAPAPAPRDFSGPQTIQQQTPTSEGIHVRGSWTITVTNPDGSLDDEYSFLNALTADGARAIVQLIAGTETIGQGGDNDWFISFESGDDFIDYFATLDIRLMGSQDNPVSSVLILTAVSEFTVPYTIDAVSTKVLTIWDNNNLIRKLTEKTLDTPVSVEAGQTVSTTVEITFE